MVEGSSWPGGLVLLDSPARPEPLKAIMKLTPPKTFAVPEGTKPGDYFKSLDEWKLLPNGDVELCSIDGCDIGKDHESAMKGMSVPERAEYRMGQMEGGSYA